MLEQLHLASRTIAARRMFTGARRPLWPVPAFDGRAPVVVETGDGDPGVDIAFADGATVPTKCPALAIWDGVIIHAEPVHLGDGYSIVVDHQNGWASYYGHLETAFAMLTNGRAARCRATVARGDAVGIIGRSSSGAPRSLRFELWRVRDRNRFIERVDPRPYLPTWSVRTRPRPSPAATNAPRLAGSRLDAHAAL
jgi:murein DD-endopeptidase MepM/ murein hydrolase activator NlpD